MFLLKFLSLSASLVRCFGDFFPNIFLISSASGNQGSFQPAQTKGAHHG
nr:MAG TPA: hypothetical protein [Caudoviricetes sp.]